MKSLTPPDLGRTRINIDCDGPHASQHPDSSDGFEAVERFRAKPVDLLLLDLNMPGKDGWAAGENITRTNPYIPTIIMTGLPDQFPIAHAAGAGALLEKPLDPEELLGVIKDLLEEPRFNHWLRRRSWLQDARSVPSTRYRPNERTRFAADGLRAAA